MATLEDGNNILEQTAPAANSLLCIGSKNSMNHQRIILEGGDHFSLMLSQVNKLTYQDILNCLYQYFFQDQLVYLSKTIYCHIFFQNLCPANGHVVNLTFLSSWTKVSLKAVVFLASKCIKQYISRSAGFCRSQLIVIYTVCDV